MSRLKEEMRRQEKEVGRFEVLPVRWRVGEIDEEAMKGGMNQRSECSKAMLGREQRRRRQEGQRWGVGQRMPALQRE